MPLHWRDERWGLSHVERRGKLKAIFLAVLTWLVLVTAVIALWFPFANFIGIEPGDPAQMLGAGIWGYFFGAPAFLAARSVYEAVDD